jgi:vitamin-K-epoxide reductase (warfarin-sensitive)
MRYLIPALALAGVAVSVLALRVHYATGTQPCDINAHWDCGIVNHSPFAMMGPVPVAAIGIAGYLVLGALAFWRKPFLLFLATIVGLGFALRLSFIEEYVLMVWCLYCVISQTIIAVITLLSLGWFTAEYAGLRRSRRAA